MNATERILNAIEKLWPLDLWQDQTIVLGVSGGADSMALMCAIRQLQPVSERCIVAHFNHAVRGHESDEDESFVREQARRLDLVCMCARASDEEIAKPSEHSLRRVRHKFFLDVAMRQGAHWIALAHHADDQVETLLNNLLRGSGPSGLAGIPTTRNIEASVVLMRPLLQVTRCQILEYLGEIGQPYRTDRSNESNQYTRNRIRNELLPFLRSFVGSDKLDRRLGQACELIGEEHRVIETLARHWLARSGYEEWRSEEEGESGFSLPLSSCISECWPVVRQALVFLWHQRQWPMREMDYEHWRRVERLLLAAAGSTHPKRTELPSGIVVMCRKGTVSISRRNFE
ncbi:MAG: tRNA lysidine(34) synthetase TilS [Pirellula sp.]